MKNELLTIGPLTIYGYGLMIAVGILAAWITASYRAKKKNLSSDTIFYLMIWCVLGGLLGAKLFFWITEIKTIFSDPGYIFDTLTDGFVVYGGIIGGILTGAIYSLVTGIDFWKYFDLIVPSVALAQGFGRIGCLLAGCCYGAHTDGLLSITFKNSDFAPNGVALIPTQIYSSLLDFAHFALLLLISRDNKKDGRVAACYMMFYSVGRFVLEFFRGDLNRGSVGILSTSQFISVFIFIVGVLIFAARKADTV